MIRGSKIADTAILDPQSPISALSGGVATIVGLAIPSPIVLVVGGVLVSFLPGLRGGLSLAAAFALPLTVATGNALPDRDRIILLTFYIILATLVVQGIGLVPLIRVLGPRSDSTQGQELQYAREIALRAALGRLDDQSMRDGVPEAFMADLRGLRGEAAARDAPA